MGEWQPYHGPGSDSPRYSRDLHERFRAYIEVQGCWESGKIYGYSWTVQDGSCGRVLDQGWEDSEIGLPATQRIVDEAIVRLFPQLVG